MLKSAMQVLTAFVESEVHPPAGELPGKTFTATPGFEVHQTGEGALTHAFEIGGQRGRRMVVPYQIWMLQRLADAIARSSDDDASRAALASFFASFDDGPELLALKDRLKGCGVRKQGARLFSLA